MNSFTDYALLSLFVCMGNLMFLGLYFIFLKAYLEPKKKLDALEKLVQVRYRHKNFADTIEMISNLDLQNTLKMPGENRDLLMDLLLCVGTYGLSFISTKRDPQSTSLSTGNRGVAPVFAEDFSKREQQKIGRPNKRSTFAENISD